MRTLFLIILTFFSTALFGQQDYLIPILKDGKYGYINLDGEIVIPFKYKKVQPFSEGLAGVREHGLYGFIDTEGKYSLPPIYDYVDTFSNGFAKVWIAGNCRLIDKMGNSLFVGNYSDLVWNKKRKQILVTTQMTNKKGVVNEKGEIIIDTLFNHLSKIQPNTYLTYDDSTELFGLINTENKVILPPMFERVDNENDSILVGRISINKYVFFDVNGNISPFFKEIISFEKHTFKIVTHTEKEGLYDTKKGILLDTIYTNIHFIGKYLIRVKNQNDELALFKMNGQKLTDFGEYKHYYPTYGNFLIAQKDEKLEYGQLKFSVFDVYGHFIHTLSFENYEYVDKSISVNARNYLKIVNIETGEIKNLNIEFGKFLIVTDCGE